MSDIAWFKVDDHLYSHPKWLAPPTWTGFGVVGLGDPGEPSRRRTRPDLCADHGHPGCTYNDRLDRTWCLCGEVVTEGDTAVPHVSCCGGPLEEVIEINHRRET
ncbi:MAG TPA: hypothetical protein GX718_01505 [Brevibacterium sp.]|nr:hypothetical protein [Brevibacterium sp.]